MVSKTLQQCSQFFTRPSYLRTRHGAPIIAVVRPRTGQYATAEGLVPQLEGTVLLSINPELRWKPTTAADHQIVKQAREQDVYLGFSVARPPSAPGAQMLEVATSSKSESLTACIVSPERAGNFPGRLSFPHLKANGAAEEYLILDSFNNWATSVPVEPSTNFGARYGSQISEWIRLAVSQKPSNV